MNEGFKCISDYLLSEQEEVNNLYKGVKNKKNSLELEIREIATKLDQMKGSIDFAYEAFSPNSNKNDFLNNEIEYLQAKQKELFMVQEEVQKEVEKYQTKLDKLKEVIKNLDETFVEDKIEEKVNEICCNKLLKEQEVERQRIAGDLHDTVVQMLTGLIHKIEFCTKIMDVDPIRVKLEMQLINTTIRDSINGIRDIIYNLRPMTFDDFGFDETLKRAAEKIEKNSNLTIDFNIEGNPYILDQMTSISLYRIMLEACFNSVKHSNANKIIINLIYLKNQVSLSIKDDGDGFDMEKYCTREAEEDARKGFGLTIMRERTLLLSGEFNINTKINQGTEVYVIIPTKERQGE